MLNVLLLIAGGAAGTLARYGLTTWLRLALGPTPLPWGTIAVNLLGCFLFGVVWAAADRRGALGGPAPLLLLTGFLGAFTTFSTFAFETVDLLRAGHPGWAAANLALQNTGGILLVLAGLAAGRWAVAPAV